MVAMPPIHGEGSPVTLAMYEAASNYERGPKRHYLGMSSIGKPCALALWYSFRGYTPSTIDGRAKMIFSLGDRVEEEVVKWLTLAGYKVSEQQRDFEALGGFFRGHWDGRVEGVTKRPHVLEIKSASSKRFALYKKQGVREVSPEYYCQVQCYMGYSGLERAMFVIMNKDNCDLYTERIYFNKDDFLALELRARTIICCNDPKKLTKNTSHCDWCDHRFRCNGGEETGHIQKDKSCGTCRWCRAAPDCVMACQKYLRQITTWGISCDAWELDDRPSLMQKKANPVDEVPF